MKKGSDPFFWGMVFFCACSAVHAQTTSPWHGTPPISVERVAPSARPVTRDTMVTQDRFANEHVALGRALAKKFANPEYAAALASRRGIPSSFDMPEEHAVRRARSRLTLARRAPQGVHVLRIPLAPVPPTVDGVVHPAEWARALRLALAPTEKRSEVLLLAHAGTLYLAALAPADRTEKGFDQFRFWFHLALSPYLDNERAFLAGRGRLSSLRGARLPQDESAFVEAGAAVALHRKTDWNIYSASRGVSTITAFRQYEMAIDLAESGIPRSGPFPAYFEIEGDPLRDAARKFKARVSLGQLGTAVAPLWMRIGP